MTGTMGKYTHLSLVLMLKIPYPSLPSTWGGLRSPQNLIRMSILTKYAGSMKITTHLYHISHCKIILVIVWYKLVKQMDSPSILSNYSLRLNLVCSEMKVTANLPPRPPLRPHPTQSVRDPPPSGETAPRNASPVVLLGDIFSESQVTPVILLGDIFPESQGTPVILHGAVSPDPITPTPSTRPYKATRIIREQL